MGMGKLTAAVWSGVLALSVPGLAAGDPKATFAELYGREAKKVAATASLKDDVEFARRLLVAAGEVEDSPAFRVLLYDKAYELAVQRKLGYVTAIEAMQRLAGCAPERKADCDEKLLKVYDLQYRYCTRDERQGAGGLLLSHLLSMAEACLSRDDATKAITLYRRAHYVARRLKSQQVGAIAYNIKAAQARQRVEREVARLSKSLAADRTNRSVARRLLMLHLTERDDPNKAAELLPLVKPDQVLETYLPLLAKPWNKLAEEAALDLARWFADLADKASAAGRPRMLARAKTYCEVYMGLHERDDAAALRAKNLLKKVERELARCGGSAAGAVSPAGMAAPPKGIRADLLVWAQKRDALPAAEQVEAVGKKLIEVNGGAEIEIESHKIVGDSVARMSIKGNDRGMLITPLFGLKLTDLQVQNGEVASLEALQGMPLKKFQMNRAVRLKSLRGLEGMPLEELRLTHAERLVDIRAIKGLSIRTLALQDCDSLTDLRPLAGMPLESACFENSEGITSIAPLKGMKLTFLHLGGCKNLRNVSVILNMPLTELDLSNLPIRSLEPLKGLKLESLAIVSCTELRDIGPLRKMPLKRLSMGRTNIRSLEPLRGMELESLNLDGCQQLKDLTALRTMSLRSLGLNETSIRSLADLKGAKLKELSIGGCPNLRSLAGLEGMPLRRLHMSRTPVRSLEPLRGAPLEDLQIGECRQIRSLKCLQGCPLRTLGAQGTRFATAAAEAEMKKLIPSLKDFRR